MPTQESSPQIVIRPETDGRSERVDLILEGKSISRLWLNPFRLHIGEALVPMAGVGGVGTEEAHRNRGHSRRVLEAAVEHMKQSDAAISMLYGIRDFYPKFGYATAGPDHLVLLTELDRDNVLPPGWSVRPFAAADFAAVQALYGGNTERSTGAALRGPDCAVWEHLLKSATEQGDNECRVVIGPDHGVHGYLWRARWCWYVKHALEPEFKQALVLGEVVADGPGAADAVLAAARIWAEGTVGRRKFKEVALAFAPEGPLAAAAMRQDARFLRNYSACGGSMARVLSVPRLLEALRPELQARLRDARSDFTGSLRLDTDMGAADLHIDARRISISEGPSPNRNRLAVSLPQTELARLALGAFPPADLLARLPEPPAKEAASLLETLFPLRYPHMHLPDRY